MTNNSVIPKRPRSKSESDIISKSESESDSDSDSDSDMSSGSLHLNRNNRNNRNNKRKRGNNFQYKCHIYNLPDDINSDNQNHKQIYESIKKDLMSKQIDLDMIIKLPNLLDVERTSLIEKYSMMNNSEEDLNLYVKLRGELWDSINYYAGSDIQIRKINMDKKKKLDSIIINTSELEEKILNLYSDIIPTSHNLYTQGLIYQKYKKLCNISPSDSEYYKLKEWIDTAIKIPHATRGTLYAKGNLSQQLVQIKEYLDRELYGMDRVKEEILMAINQRFTNPLKSDTNIALVGPPGVGKTQLISVLAKILDWPFEHISMGGTNDSSFLAGHSYTYEGAKPGKIVDSLIKMKCTNGIIFFDEIDKIADTSNGKEVSNQLLHITDFTQNDHFCDKYLPEIPIDLSHIWFIFSLNSVDQIDPILSNRLNYIYVDGYSKSDKLTICKNHLLPSAYDKYKLDRNKYNFTNDILDILIDHSIKKEQELLKSDKIIKSGIRELKRTIDHIFNRLSLLENISNIKKNSNTLNNLSFCPTDIKDLKITKELINIFLK